MEGRPPTDRASEHSLFVQCYYSPSPSRSSCSGSAENVRRRQQQPRLARATRGRSVGRQVGGGLLPSLLPVSLGPSFLDSAIPARSPSRGPSEGEMRSVFHLAFFPHRVLGLPLLPFYLRLGGREEGDERERWSARWYDGEGRHGLDGGTSRERPPDGRTQSEIGGTLEWKAKTWKGPKGRKERESGGGRG